MRAVFYVLVLLAVLVSFAVFAQPATIPDPSDVSTFAAAVLEAIRDRNWGYVVGAGLILVVFVVRTYGPKFPKIGPALSGFLQSNPGGVTVAFFSALGLTLGASALVPGAVFGWPAVLAALKVALASVGVFTVLKKFFLPIGQWILGKLFPSGSELAKQITAVAEKSGEEAGKVALESPEKAAEELAKANKE